MKNVIWDLDGTLLDSYPLILAALEETYSFFKVEWDEALAKKLILEQSTKDLIKMIADENQLDYTKLLNHFSASLKSKNDQIKLMKFAKEILDLFQQNNIQQFVYTHKGKNTFEVLDRLGIDSYFTEIITSENQFSRKPNSEAVDYLVDKYQMNHEKTYYIGDRKIDADLAKNAGIRSINLKVASDGDNVKIESLGELRKFLIN